MEPNENNDNTIFEQDGKVYAICSHDVPTKELAKFISEELRYMHKVPRAKMRIVTTEEFRKMPFGRPSKEKKDGKETVQPSLLANRPRSPRWPSAWRLPPLPRGAGLPRVAAKSYHYRLAL